MVTRLPACIQDFLPDAVSAVRKATEALRAVYPEEHDLVGQGSPGAQHAIEQGRVYLGGEERFLLPGTRYHSVLATGCSKESQVP